MWFSNQDTRNSIRNKTFINISINSSRFLALYVVGDGRRNVAPAIQTLFLNSLKLCKSRMISV